MNNNRTDSNTTTGQKTETLNKVPSKMIKLKKMSFYNTKQLNRDERSNKRKRESA